MASAGGVFAPAASAALALGGGAGIIVDGSYCTLTTIGHDKAGEMVGFTAASCGGPDSPVVAEGSEGLGPVGTVVAIADDPRLNYSVIKFDPAKVTPIPNFAGFVIDGVGPEPERGQPVCRLGAATGDFCGHKSSFDGPGPHMGTGGGNYLPGDNGAPVTADGLLVGLVTGGLFLPPSGVISNTPRQLIYTTKFSAILDEVNAGTGPGAGFTPIGS